MSIEAMKMALKALEDNDGLPICNETDLLDLSKEITALRAAIADTQDWSEVEALRESLREHMAEMHRLRAALAEGAMQRLTDVQQEMEQKPAIYPEEARELGLEEIPCKGVVFKDYEVASNTLNKQDAK